MKLKTSQLFDLEQIAETGIGIVDALVTICRCNSDVAAGLAYDLDIQVVYDLGRAKGVANLMAVLERESGKGNISAVNALMRAGKVSADLDQAAYVDVQRKRSVRVIDVGASVRAMIADQKRLVEENWPPPTRSEAKLPNGISQPLETWQNDWK
jgi:hypothetical protein